MESIKFDSRNARKHGDRNRQTINESLRKCGAGRSIVLDADDVIVAGNGVYEQAQALGLKVRVVETDGSELVAVKRTDIKNTDDKRKLLALADNRTAELAEWDNEALEKLIAELPEIDLNGIGFDENALAEIGIEAERETADAEPQINKAEELNKIWKVKAGDLFSIGEHRLLCGDSGNDKDVARVMGGGMADFVFTDPPYGVSIGDKNVMLNTFQKAGKCLANIESDCLKPDELYKILVNVFKNVNQFLKDCCSVYVCAPQGGGLCMMMMMMMRDAGLEIRHVLIWVKNSPTFSMGRLDYDYQHEPILFTWKKTHNRVMAGNYKTSVWNVDKPRKCDLHPTMKPVELVENALLNSTNKNDIALEPFSGSGTTFIACQNLSRKCYGIEISSDYCAVILQRMTDAFPGIEIRRIES